MPGLNLPPKFQTLKRQPPDEFQQGLVKLLSELEVSQRGWPNNAGEWLIKNEPERQLLHKRGPRDSGNVLKKSYNY